MPSFVPLDVQTKFRYELLEQAVMKGLSAVSHKYPCPCCDHLTLDGEPPGTFEVCPVCHWEDDEVQYNDPSFEGGANEESLEQARANFGKIGASSESHLSAVRPPLAHESPEKKLP